MSRIAVVGSGMAGLTAAHGLAGRGFEVVVWDKGRRPGGRLSSRRRGVFDFDHGAQYFTARDPRFRSLVDEWIAQGVLAPWNPRVRVFGPEGTRSGEEHARFVGAPRMRSLAEHLSRGLDVRSGVRIARVERAAQNWRLFDETGGERQRADVLIVTVPPTQAVPLLESVPRLAERASPVVLRPCWAVLLGFTRPLEVDFDAAFVNEGALSWVARNSSKPGRGPGEAWVLHAGPDWSARHADSPPADVIERLERELFTKCDLSSLPEATHAEAHWWRWAIPDPPLAEPCLYDEELRVGVGGDWCGGPRVEGAWRSGTELANRVAGRGDGGPDGGAAS